MSDVDAILEQRQSEYGDPVQQYVQVAQMWSAIIDAPITPHQASLMMVALKLIRAARNPDHKDSHDDARGYLQIAELIAGHRASLTDTRHCNPPTCYRNKGHHGGCGPTSGPQ